MTDMLIAMVRLLILIIYYGRFLILSVAIGLGLWILFCATDKWYGWDK